MSSNMLVSNYLFEVLNGKVDSSALIKWILGDLSEDPLPEIQRNEFALFFLNYLQEQTSSVIESCPSNRRDESSCTQTHDSKKIVDNEISANRDNITEGNVKQTLGHVRKIFTSPRDESAAHSLKRVTPQPQPQPCEPFSYSPHHRNGLPISASFPGNNQYNNSVCLATVPMIFDHRLGYSVPYYGNRNYNDFYHLQSNSSTVPNQNFVNNYTNRNNYLHDRNAGPNFVPLQQQLHNNSAFNSSRCSSPGVNVPTNCNTLSPKKCSKVYQTPKTPESNKVGPKTPNSNSSSSSGVSLMSPESPLYSENFPVMGSNERRYRRESLSNYSDSVSNQSRKHSHNKKRIKPVQLNNSLGNNGLEGKFGVITDSCDKAARKFPDRKQNFFEEKGFSNRKVVNDLDKSNFTKPELEKSVEEKKMGDDLFLQGKCNNETSPEIKNNHDLTLDTNKIEDAEDKTKSSKLDDDNNKAKSCVDKKSTKSKSKGMTVPDPLKVNFQIYLNKLAEIYSALLDANLIPNITAEIYFIFSLLTIDGSKKKFKSKVKKSDSNESCEGTEDLCDRTQAISLQLQNEAQIVEANIELQLFHSVHQFIYFSCAVISRQKHLLAILDKTALKLLMENKRLFTFVPEIVEFLKSLYETKDKEFRCKQETNLNVERTFINPVPFQMEVDNRDTFSSQTSFQVFRKQRDAFYEILQIWNEKHEKRDWHFNFLSLKIEKLFLMSTDPVNMRHLARHFCDLLLKTVCAKDKAEEYSVCGLPEIDKSKLNRLTERLIRPSLSGQKDPRPSPDFPGLQAFYHDFLVIPAANYSFHTHVINCLAEQIHFLNGTSFQFEEPDGQMVQEETRLAFLKCLQSLCVLAKFLGLVVFSPFRSSNELPQSVLQDEISFRNKIHPPVDLQNYLSIAEEEGRLVQTVPWVVEYLGMMDTVAPFLTSYQAVLNTLFSLYLCTAPHLFSSLPYVHSSNEKLLMNEANQGSNAEIAEHKSDISLLKRSKLSYQSAVLLRLTIGWLFDASNFSQSLFFKMASSYKGYQPKQQTEEKWCNMTVDNSDIVDEKFLHEFCPYLINLRVRLAESTENNKQGPIRHITPVPSQQAASSKILAATTLELQLEENFFMGQSESLKRTVDFAAERAASACIKHICSNIIVGLKSSVLKATSSNKVVDLQPYIDKYNEDVEKEIENVIRQRLNVALSVLLGPDVIEQSLNKICQQIAARKLRERVVNWLQSHINLVDVLTKSQGDGNGQSDNSSQNQTDRVPNDCMTFSEALILMQDNLNDILDSRGNEGIKDSSGTIAMFKNLSATMSFYRDNSLNIKLLLSLVLDYLLLSVTYQPKMVTNDVLDEFCMLWKSHDYTGPLARLLSPRNMMLLVQGGPENSSLTWERFGRIIVFALTHDVMTISSLESQAVAFFRYNWPNDLLLAMSKCLSGILEDVRKHRSCIEDPKFVLMLELCSDMAADMNTGFEDLDF